MSKATGTYKVLEIGSGSVPDPRADILVDRHISDNTERNRVEPIRRDGRPLIAADGAALPFVDKSFDLVLAIGVLEHTETPVQFLEEMARVGKRGVVHVPTTFAERILLVAEAEQPFALDHEEQLLVVVVIVVRARLRFGRHDREVVAEHLRADPVADDAEPLPEIAVFVGLELELVEVDGRFHAPLLKPTLTFVN